MAIPTTGTIWNNAAYASTATISNHWISQFYGSGPSTTTTSYFQHCPRQLSAAEMIASLQRDGHVVLQKKHHVVAPNFQQTSYKKHDLLFNTNIPVHYGYALPEKEGDYLMPDGSILKVDRYGNYQVLDQDAKVTYKANRIREFNPYISASDLLEKFIREVGRMDGVNQGEVLRLPIEAFINWLILQAATKDGDSLEGLPSVEAALPRSLPPLPTNPRCLGCGRFINKDWVALTSRLFCSREHWDRFQKRLAHVRDRASLLRIPQGDQLLCLP